MSMSSAGGWVLPPTGVRLGSRQQPRGARGAVGICRRLEVAGARDEVRRRPYPSMQRRASEILEQEVLSSPPLDQAEAAQAADTFVWTKQWYALAVAEDVEKDRPYPFTLLGQPIVIWWDGSGWRCAEDRCPHRAAPLSEGKVWSDGTLMCSYHGWRFRGEDGACVAIPQAASAEVEAAACASGRSCAATRPIQEWHGLLFVWGESGPRAATESAASRPPLLEQWDKSNQKINILFKPYHRDLPYDYQTLVENVVDPAHVPFSHHGIQGDRAKVKHGQFEMRRLDKDNPLVVGPAAFFDQVEFIPPSTIAYTTNKKDGGWGAFCSFATPTTPGRCRIVALSVNTYKKLHPLLAFLSLWPRWLEHMVTRHSVLDGDSIFLHMQEHKVAEEEERQEQRLLTKQLASEKAGALAAPGGCATGTGASPSGPAWKTLYFMPTAADLLVMAFRNWLETRGGGGPFGPLHASRAYPPLISDRRVLLDRWDAHTTQCAACRKAFSVISQLRTAAAAGAALAFSTSLYGILAASAAAASAAGQAAPLVLVLPTAADLAPSAWSAAAGVVLALAWRVLSQLRQRFIFVDYIHATR